MVEQKGHEEARSPRERVARMRALAIRGLKYWKGSLFVLLLAGGTAYTVAVHIPRVYRSECTIIAKARIRTDDRDESSTSPDALARQAARLKDMLTTRARLESTIRKFDLYPDITATRTMLDAVEQMKPHVGFRSLEGGQYVISFDGDDPEKVRNVTQYLADSLIDQYAAGDLSDLQREADFLGEEEEHSLAGLETSTRALTLFLAAHPEFALEAKQAAATPFGPFGQNTGAAGIPLMPKLPADSATSDPDLAALLRERSRLEGEVRSATAVARGLAPANASKKQLDDQIAQTQAEVEAAAKRVAETQADLASKSNLTEDHPDMRAARMAADAAARTLHETKVKLGALQQLAASGSAPDLSQAPPDLSEKLHQVDAQIAARRARPASSSATDPHPPVNPVVRTVVELETDWQRLLRALNEAKNHHEDLKLRAERARLALGAAHAQASERMAVIDPPYRPTHPAKGKRATVAIGGLLMAWLLAIAYAVLRVTLDDTLVDADDVEALGIAGVLGVVPRIDPLPDEELGHGTV